MRAARSNRLPDPEKECGLRICGRIKGICGTLDVRGCDEVVSKMGVEMTNT